MNTAVKFRNLQISKIPNTDTSRIFPIPFKVMHISLRLYSLKNNSAVWVEPKVFPYFLLNWRYFSEIYKKRNNNPLLSKSTLRNLVFCQVFWVEVWRLNDQCIYNSQTAITFANLFLSSKYLYRSLKHHTKPLLKKIWWGSFCSEIMRLCILFLINSSLYPPNFANVSSTTVKARQFQVLSLMRILVVNVYM